MANRNVTSPEQTKAPPESRQTTALRVSAWIAGVAFLIKCFAANAADVDIWGNVGFVRALPWTRDFMWVNTFSFVEPNMEWINHSWLSQFLFWNVKSMFGSEGLLALKLALGALLAFIALRCVRGRGATGSITLLLGLGALSNLAFGSSVRPHLFTYILVALFLARLSDADVRPRTLLCVLPALGALWTNLHGAFFIGAGLLAIVALYHLVAWRWRQAGLTGAAFALYIVATGLNPYGYSIWRLVLHSAGTPRPYLHEWTHFGDVAGVAEHPDFVALAALGAVALLTCGRWLPGLHRAFLVVSFCAALILLRNIPLFAITAFMLLTPALSGRWGGDVKRVFDRFAPAWRIALLWLFSGVSLYTTVAGKHDPTRIEVERSYFPVEIVRYLQERKVEGRALVYFDWAEQVIWHLHPRIRVFLDGRFESAYSTRAIIEYMAFLENRSPDIAARHDADLLLLPPELKIAETMRRHPEWRVAAVDRSAVLLVRADRHPELAAEPRDLSDIDTPAYFP